MVAYKERRKGTLPVPDDPLKYLNAEQLFTCRRMQALGWKIKFIRRPLYQRVICVLTNQDESLLAVIEQNGMLNKHPYISFRDAEIRVEK